MVKKLRNYQRFDGQKSVHVRFNIPTKKNKSTVRMILM